MTLTTEQWEVIQRVLPKAAKRADRAGFPPALFVGSAAPHEVSFVEGILTKRLARQNRSDWLVTELVVVYFGCIMFLLRSYL